MCQIIQFVVGARRNGYLILGFSVVSIVLSIGIFGIGTLQVAEIDVEEKAIFTGRSGSVPVENYATYSVFAVSDYACEDVEVSIYQEDEEYVWEYFYRDCDDDFDEEGWVYVGFFTSDVDGSLNVDANRQILIIDDMAYFDEGGAAVLLSLPFCCLGFIGLIIAVTVLITAKEKVQDTSVNPGIVFIEPTSPPAEKIQNDVDEDSEWWETGSSGDISKRKGFLNFQEYSELSVNSESYSGKSVSDEDELRSLLEIIGEDDWWTVNLDTGEDEFVQWGGHGHGDAIFEYWKGGTMVLQTPMKKIEAIQKLFDEYLN